MSRYGNVKAGAYTKMNLESSSDTDLENLNDIEKVLGKIGIRIRSTNTEFRSFSEVLEELSDKWINLDNVSKNAIATAMAGVRQREQFLVLMENMERVEELEQVSATSQGTAEQKYAAYMETIESASNRLQSAWENLAMTLEQSGLVKLFTDISVVLMKYFLPALRALGAASIQYNAFKVPTWMKEFFSGKGKGLLSGLGSRKFAQYRQDWKASKLKEMQDKSAEEATEAANSKLAQSATSTASALDKVTESASQGAAAEAQGTKEESKNISATARDTDETKKHTQAVTQDTNKQKTGDVPGKEGGKIKDYFKASLSNVPGAILGGALSGFATGVGTEGSTTAKAVSGVVAGGLTALGGAFAGPIGAMIGSTIGSFVAEPIANAIDKEEIARKERIEAASKLLETLKSQEAAVDSLVKVSRSENLLSDDIKSIRDNVQAIKDAGENGDATREAFINIVNEELKDSSNADLLRRLNVGTAQSLYDNLEYILTDKLISSELRTQVAEWMERANIRSQRSAFLASKEGKTLTSADEKQLLKYDLREAYKKSGVSNMGSMELTQMGTAAVEQMIAKIAGKELTTEVRRMIQLMMKQDDSTSVQSLLAGGKFTLSDVVKNTYGLSGEVQLDLLNQAALALGMTVDEVKERVDDFGLLTIGDLNSSVSDLATTLDTLSGYLDEFMSTGTLSIDSLREIISANGAESTALGNGDLSIINKATEQTYRKLGGSLLKDWTSSSASGAGIYKELLEDPKMKDALATLDTGGFNIDNTSMDDLFKALMTSGFGKLGQDIQDKIWEKYLETYKEAAKNIGNVTTAAYEKTFSAAQDAIDRSLERQQTALEEQKSALEQINKQREYENKLIEAKIKLENAQNEKKKVWREGVGWVYEADTSAIADAQKELEELDNEKQINELQVMIDEFQAQRDWISELADSKEFERAQEFMKQWANNADSTMEVLKFWENTIENPPKFNVLEENTELKKQQINATDYQNSQTVEALKQAYTDLVDTEGGKLLLNGGSLADLGKMELKDIDAFNEARSKFEKAYSEASPYLDSDTIRQLTGLSGDEGGKTVEGYKTMFSKTNKGDGGVGNITSGVGQDTSGLGKTSKADQNYDYLSKQIGKEWQVTGKQTDIPGVKDYSKTLWSSAKGSIFFWSDSKQKWIPVQESRENPKSYAAMLNTPGLQDRFFYYGKHFYYLGKDGVMYAVEDTSSYATGTLSAPGGISMVNDDPQYGLEGIITPQGTLTALPSKSGVVSADMTRNVWQLGEVAPNLIKQLVDINGKFNSPLGFGTDESFNVDHLDVHMVAQPGFDMDDFVRRLRAARDLSKHS